MPKFHYIAMNAAGGVTASTIDADTIDVAHAKLNGAGLSLLTDLKEVLPFYHISSNDLPPSDIALLTEESGTTPAVHSLSGLGWLIIVEGNEDSEEWRRRGYSSAFLDLLRIAVKWVHYYIRIEHAAVPAPVSETRKVRAARARAAVRAYAEDRGTDDEDDETNLADLLADIAHFCDKRAYELSHLLGTAEENYREECQEEGGIPGQLFQAIPRDFTK